MEKTDPGVFFDAGDDCQLNARGVGGGSLSNCSFRRVDNHNTSNLYNSWRANPHMYCLWNS